MPVQDCRVDGRKGKRWGKSGKCYVGPGGLRKALRQARAIKVSQSARNALGSRYERLVHLTGNVPVSPARFVLNRTQVVPSNPLKADPTRTATLRRKFQTAISVRFARLRRKIVDLVAVEDAFGLRMRTQSPFTNNEERDDESVSNKEREAKQYKRPGVEGVRENTGENRGEIGQAEGGTGKDTGKVDAFGTANAERRVGGVINQRWVFRSDAEKLRLFQEWLRAETQLEILAGAQAAIDEAYWQAFVEEGYRKGAGRAFDDTRKAALWTGAEGEFYRGTREEFLRSSFGRPVAIGKVKLLAGRVFTDLKGVTEVMNTKMTRILAEGLAQGQNPAEMARTMIKDGMGFTKTRGIQSRAMTIARTEVIRAHAEGQLDAMEDLGVTEVGVMVEWSTAGDDIVCPQCASMEGVVLKIKEARGIIPRHPNCVVGESVVECDDAISVLKAHYTGEIIKFVTAKGRRLSITPNHILLTEYGFLPARFAYEGLKVLEAPIVNTDSVVAPDNDADESCIADIFTAFSEYLAVFSKSVPLAPEYLHGDGSLCNPEVDIVCPDSELWDEKGFQGGMRAIVESQFPAFKFAGAEAILSALSPTTQLLKGIAGASESSMGRFRELLALLLGRLLHAKIHRSTLTSGAYLSVYKAFVDRAATDLKPFGESLDAHPTLKQFCDLSLREIENIALGFSSNVLSGFDVDTRFFETVTDTVIADLESLGELRRCLPVTVSLDEIVGIDVVHVSKLPVYDVETSSTLYRVNGLVTSNCRCAHIPANVGESQKKQIRGKLKVQKAIDDSIRETIPKGRHIKGKGLRYQDPETKRFTSTSKRTLSQQKNRSSWAGADRTVAKVRPRARVEPRGVKPTLTSAPVTKASPSSLFKTKQAEKVFFASGRELTTEIKALSDVQLASVFDELNTAHLAAVKEGRRRVGVEPKWIKALQKEKVRRGVVKPVVPARPKPGVMKVRPVKVRPVKVTPKAPRVVKPKPVKPRVLRELKAGEMVRGSHSGQVDATFFVSTPEGLPIAKIDYSELGDEIHIEMIQTLKEHEGRGVATEMFERFAQDNPGKEIKWGMLTDEGAALKRSLEKKGVLKATPTLTQTKPSGVRLGTKPKGG